MAFAQTLFPNTLGQTRPSLTINPAVLIGMGDFGGAALHLLASRLRPIHPALLESVGWLWLTESGWQDTQLEDDRFGAALRRTITRRKKRGRGRPSTVTIAPEPLGHALDHALSQSTAAALRDAGYVVGKTLDSIIVTRMGELFTRRALWQLLDLLRDQTPAMENRVTLILTSDSRRFTKQSSARFFDELAERLIADRTNPTSGAISWCYLCDTLDIDKQVLGGEDDSKHVVQSQLELTGGFLTLLVGSTLRSDLTYARTAMPHIGHDTISPPDAALVSSFGLGAYVLPIDAIATLAREQLALRLHETTFPSKASAADREAAWYARGRLLAITDLSPQDLRERLLQAPEGRPIQFDTTPPDLTGLEPETALRTLDQWQADLEASWTDEDTSPPAQIAHNADTLLAEVADGVSREASKLAGGDPRGLHRALAFLDLLPQLIEEARADTSADDSYYRKRTIPSIDRRLSELDKLISTKQRIQRRDVILVSLAFVPIVILTLFLKRGVLPFVLAGWLMTAAAIQVARPWRRRRQLLSRQADLIVSLQFKYQAALERQMRVERRGLFDALLATVRLQRGELLSWQEAISSAKATLARAGGHSFQPACGERLLRDPVDYPLPVDGYDENKINEIAAQYLDQAARPHWQKGDSSAIVAWLRQGAEQALAGWRWAIHVAAWNEPERSHVIADLLATTQVQWPLTPNERPPIELDLIGLAEREELVLPQRGKRALVVSTFDPSRLSFVPTYHGLPLKELAAIRPLLEHESSSHAD